MRPKLLLVVNLVLVIAALPGVEAARAEGPGGGSAALLLVEYGEDASGDQTQILKRYTFRNGRLVSTEEILATRTDDVRYDLGRNRIHRGRYVITHWGDVVDVKTWKLLHEGEGEVLAVDGDLVVIRVNRADREGVFVYDLGSGQYRRLSEAGVSTLSGIASPNGRRILEWSFGSELWLRSLDGKRRSLGDGFGGGALSPDCSSTDHPSALWIDNSRIVAQRGNGRIFLVDVDKGTIEPVTEVPLGEDNFGCAPTLDLDADGRVLLSWSGKVVAVDVAGRSYAPYPWISLGNGFRAEERRSASYGHAIALDDREIGRFWCDPWSAASTKGYLAVEYGPVGSNLGYPQGVKVWSDASREWTTIDPGWHTTILGWSDAAR